MKRRILPLICSLATLTTTVPAFADAASPVQFYGSLRVGIDNVQAGIEGDGANGRDYLSRVGVKASKKLDDGLTAVGQIEYGLRGVDAVNSSQMDSPTLRLLTVGLEGEFGRLLYGSQDTLFSTYVGNSYFSDGNDTIRLGAGRDDDLTSYFYKGQGYTLAAAVQTEGQDGDSVDSYSLAGDMASGAFKLQLAAIKDSRGDETGNLLGVRAWYDFTSDLTVSVYRHQQTDSFDLYNGSSGNLVLKGAGVDGTVNVNGVGNCKGEARDNTGLYAAYKLGKGKVHGRYAVDSCEDAGDIRSSKLEYTRVLGQGVNYWVAYELLNSDEARKPSTGKDFREAQVGIRLDF